MKRIISLIFILAFVSTAAIAQVQTGKASFYANKFEGRLTASGVKYHHNKATAAHRHLPFGTKIRVTNMANNKSTVVEVNDRGPFVGGRIIDLSRSAAKKLDFIGAGVTDVIVEVVGNPGDAIKDLEPVANTKPNQQESTTTASNNNTQNNSNANNTVQPEEFYELSINRIKPDWYGVQIGSFQELANLIRLADNLKSSYQKNVTVQVKDINGIKIYSLVIGKFSKRKRADRFKERVNKRYPDSFIVDFAQLTSN